eukprot:TRINITY_DN37042_c0_g1_i1.p1 TRINITY_DN37042_c0_g1~~TRINITY_DN37042_c0_g1_i1.p1  ORF type:complete len:665 (+),score=173.41 TRINITY_DN37042_c0_g1_i1:25-2019(+)
MSKLNIDTLKKGIAQILEGSKEKQRKFLRKGKSAQLRFLSAIAPMLWLACCFLTLHLGWCRDGRKPNILFLMSDEMDGRIVDPTSAESKAVEMPFLRDFFGKHGTSFVRAYSNNPVCVPSRSSLITGRSTDRIEVWGNSRGIAAAPDGSLDEACVKSWGETECSRMAKIQGKGGAPATFFSALENLGYDVHYEGKLHFGAGYCNNISKIGPPYSQYWSAFDGKAVGEWGRAIDLHMPQEKEQHALEEARNNEYSHEFSYSYVDYNIANRCLDWIDGLPSPDQQTKPFFLYCSVNLPHYTFSTNATWLAKVNDDEVKLPRELPGFPDKWHPYDAAMVMSKGLGGNLEDEDVLRLRKVYYAMSAEADDTLASIWNGLTAKGYSLDDTYLVYVSDHGDLNMDHRQYAKSSMYEGSTRVPLQIAGPGVKKGVVSHDIVQLLDVFPTLLDMGQETNWREHEQLQGQSLLAAAGAPSSAPQSMQFKSEGAGARDFVVSQYHYAYGVTGSYMVRSGKWKLITFGHNFGPYEKYVPQLFDVEEDPEELNDVAAANPDVVASLDAKLKTVLDPEEVDRRAKESDFRTFLALFDGENANFIKFRQAVVGSFRGCDKQMDTCMGKALEWAQEASQMFTAAPLSIEQRQMLALKPASASVRPARKVLLHRASSAAR